MVNRTELRVATGKASSSGPIDDPQMSHQPDLECPACGAFEVFYVPEQEGACHSGGFKNHWGEGYWCQACETDLEEA